jgi:hypothetical protein
MHSQVHFLHFRQCMWVCKPGCYASPWKDYKATSAESGVEMGRCVLPDRDVSILVIFVTRLGNLGGVGVVITVRFNFLAF